MTPSGDGGPGALPDVTVTETSPDATVTRTSPDVTVTELDRRPAAWRLFIENAARVQTALEERLRSEVVDALGGMTLADYHLLLCLSEAPGRRLRMRDLSQRMVFSASRLKYQVDALCRRGWLRRESAPEDRRGSYAVLTGAGLTAFETAAAAHHDDVTELFFSALDLEDGHALESVMRRLSDHLDTLQEQS